MREVEETEAFYGRNGTYFWSFYSLHDTSPITTQFISNLEVLFYQIHMNGAEAT
jgi:hypothetical protein